MHRKFYDDINSPIYGGISNSICSKPYGRQASLEDINLDQFLKISNYEETIKQLDIYYGIVKRQLLQNQSEISGLFPVVSNDKEASAASINLIFELIYIVHFRSAALETPFIVPQRFGAFIKHTAALMTTVEKVMNSAKVP